MITRETDYALRLLRTLRDGERRTAAEAAERELVPQSFAHKILKKLARAGFVEVARGAERVVDDQRHVAPPGHSLRPDDRYGRGFPPKQLYGSHLFLSLAGQPWRLYGSLPSDRHSGKAECGTEGPHFGGHSGSGRLIFSPTNWINFIHF